MGRGHPVSPTRSQGNARSGGGDIWARRVPCVGLPSVPAIPLSGALEVQSRCELAHNDLTTEFLAVWQDFRNSNYDIFGQRWMKLPRSRLHRVLPGHDAVP